MALWIQIASGSNEPIFLQVVSQVGRAIATGELAVGEKLPPIRELAADLVLNPNTVARAYSLLEQRGLVVTKAGSGTFVADVSLRSGDAAQIRLLAQRMDSLIAQGVNLGLSADDIAQTFAERLKDFFHEAKKGRARK